MTEKIPGAIDMSRIQQTMDLMRGNRRSRQEIGADEEHGEVSSLQGRGGFLVPERARLNLRMMLNGEMRGLQAAGEMEVVGAWHSGPPEGRSRALCSGHLLGERGSLAPLVLLDFFEAARSKVVARGRDEKSVIPA
jgi:hypothetical protein